MLRIERWYIERDGPLSEVAVHRKIESFRFVVSARLYPVGRVELPSHTACTCLSAVVRGLIKLTVDGEPAYLAPGDIAFVPPGASRSLEALGPSAPLFLEALPRDGGG